MPTFPPGSALWIAAIGAAAGVAAFLVVAGHARASGWALMLFFSIAAVMAAIAHVVTRRMDPVARYLARHQRLAGPRQGAELPG